MGSWVPMDASALQAGCLICLDILHPLDRGSLCCPPHPELCPLEAVPLPPIQRFSASALLTLTLTLRAGATHNTAQQWIFSVAQ